MASLRVDLWSEHVSTLLGMFLIYAEYIKTVINMFDNAQSVHRSLQWFQLILDDFIQDFKLVELIINQGFLMGKV